VGHSVMQVELRGHSCGRDTQGSTTDSLEEPLALPDSQNATLFCQQALLTASFNGRLDQVTGA